VSIQTDVRRNNVGMLEELALNLNVETTVSGLSSGGFMALQLEVAFSETFKGF